MSDSHALISDFFTNLVGQEIDLEIDQVEDEIYVNVQLDPELSGVVIGYRGEVLAGIQLVLSLMLQQDRSTWIPVRVNVNNYRQQRGQALEMLARNTAERVLNTGQAMSLPNLSSYERRMIHNVLSEIEGVVSFSEGEGPNRVLIIDLDNQDQ